MVKYSSSRRLVLGVLTGNGPMNVRSISKRTGLSRSQVYNSLALCWRRGLVLRTTKPIYSHETVFKGRGGSSMHTQPFHLYLLRPESVGEVEVSGRRYVGYAEERALGFLREHFDGAFFSKEVVEGLEEHGVRPRDVMSSVRRFERHGLVYVRGYKTDDWQTPFREGYLLTRALHLLRGVGGRRRAAEVDRVWEVNPGVFAPPITYVLSCK